VETALQDATENHSADRTANIARSIRERFGMVLSEEARKPLSHDAWQELTVEPTDEGLGTLKERRTNRSSRP